MDINTNTNKHSAAQNATAEITLALTTFHQKVAALTGGSKSGWTGDDQNALITQLLSELKTPDGKPAVFTIEQQNVLRLIFRPTEAAQRTVLNQVFAEAGYLLAPETEGLLMLLFATGQFGKFLAENTNPVTGKPFIAKSKKKNAKKNAFEAVLKSISKTSGIAAPFITPPNTVATEAVSHEAAKQVMEEATK